MKKEDTEFRRKVLEPWLIEWPPGEDQRCICAICRREYFVYQIQACHIKAKGAHFEVKYHPLNGFAACSGPGTLRCHGVYDALPERDQKIFIKNHFPGRWEALERLIKERAFV